MTVLSKAKQALRIANSVTAYDSEVTDLIHAASIDLTIAGVSIDNVEADSEDVDSVVLQAILTYVKANFGYVANTDYEKLKKSYDEQKAQLVTATGYTKWSDSDD